MDFFGADLSWRPIAVALLVCGVLVALLLPKPKGAPPFVSFTSAAWRIPVIGHFISFTKPIDMIRDHYRDYGPVFSMNMMGQCLTFLVGPAAQEPFFRGKDEQLSQAAVYGFMTPVFGKGVVYDTTKSRRTQQMKLLANSLGTKNMRTYVPMIVAEAEAFFAKWGEAGTVDLKVALPELIILTASRCLMGDEVRKTLFQQVADLYHDLDKGIKPISFFFPNLPIPDHFARDRARVEMVKLFGPVISKRRAVFDAAAGDAAEVERLAGEDVLAALISFQYKDEGAGRRPLTDDEITGLLIALLFAGQHTSSLTSAWAVMLVVSNPDCLAKVLAEQEAVLGEHDGELSFDALKSMDYLHAAVKETLRLHPPLIMLMRKVLTPLTVPGKDGATHVVPAGHIVVTAPKYANYLPDVFREPDAFDPQRFLPGRLPDGPEDLAQRHAFISFGGGMHACMGQQFAYLQLKTVLSVLLRGYDLELVAKELPESDYEAMVVGPKGPCLVRYKKKK